MKNWKVILLVILMFSSVILNAKTIVIDSKLDIIKQFDKSNVTYYINNVIDLKEDTLHITNNCILKFSKSGRICNGMVIGSNTVIKASKHLIFKNVSLDGTWRNKYVYSQWLDLIEGGESNNKQFKNLMTLCSGTESTNLYTQEGEFYFTAINNSAPIIVPSNTYWHNKSILKLKECNYTKYSLVLLNKVNNVTIDGGEFVGDLVNHQGSEGEWGHGIKCGGSQNIVLRNLTCRNFWGDGIDLIEGLDSNYQPTIICDNVIIDNVKCLYNRRQGLSVEAAQNVKILNSEFSHTGVLKKTSPSAGIDIEPWNNNGKKISNIIINNCIISDNKGADLQIYIPKDYNVNNSKQDFINISVVNCLLEYAFLCRVVGVNFKQCDIKDVIRIDFSDYVRIDSATKIKRQVLNDNGQNIVIK